jgi:transcriptional regulator with XRE-family HTH domain
MDHAMKTTEELERTLGAGVKALRIAQPWTQRQLATKAGVSVGAVANLERGKGSSTETFVRLLQAMKATHLLENLAPRPLVSPLALLRSVEPVQRVRHRVRDRLAS